jgi:hypothetical protein
MRVISLTRGFPAFGHERGLGLLAGLALLLALPSVARAGFVRIDLSFDAAGFTAVDVNLDPLPTPDAPADTLSGSIVFYFDPHQPANRPQDSLLVNASNVSLEIDGHRYAPEHVLARVLFRFGDPVGYILAGGPAFVSGDVIRNSPGDGDGFRLETGLTFMGDFQGDLGGFLYHSSNYPSEGDEAGLFDVFAGSIEGTILFDKTIGQDPSTWGRIKSLFEP